MADMTPLDMLLIEEDDMHTLFDENPVDIGILDDIPTFKDEVDLISNATTDECSPVSSPSSDYSDSTSSGSPVHKVHTYPVATAYPWMPAVIPTALPLTAKVPFAMPIGVLPPTNKRVLEDTSATQQSKRTKHEIRLMKNRESANKSRLRRKNQVTDLSAENAQLKARLAERDAQLAARDATIKSLMEQLDFLRGLVTNGGATNRATTEDSTTPAANSFDKTKLAAPAAGIVLCAFIFGLTLFSDPYANSAPKVAPHRRSMRVVHGMSPAVPVGSNMFVATAPASMLYMLSEYAALFGSMWLTLASVLIVALLCILVMRSPKEQPQVHVNVSLNELGPVHRLCNRASRWVAKTTSSVKLSKVQ
ncbi:unnamed protein product [Aphanomyces euteiches]